MVLFAVRRVSPRVSVGSECPASELGETRTHTPWRPAEVLFTQLSRSPGSLLPRPLEPSLLCSSGLTKDLRELNSDLGAPHASLLQNPLDFHRPWKPFRHGSFHSGSFPPTEAPLLAVWSPETTAGMGLSLPLPGCPADT